MAFGMGLVHASVLTLILFLRSISETKQLNFSTFVQKQCQSRVIAWIEKPVKNRSVFVKIGETSSDQFHQFLINRLVNLIFFILIFFKKWFIGFGTVLSVF
jgi:hypothetical protein